MVPYYTNTERDVKHHNDIISPGYCSSRKMCSFMNRWSEFSGLSDLWSVFAVCFFSDTNHHCLQSEGEVVFAVKKDTDSVYISLILKLTTRFGFSYFPTKMLLSTPSSSDFVQPKSHITQEKTTDVHLCIIILSVRVFTSLFGMWICSGSPPFHRPFVFMPPLIIASHLAERQLSHLHEIQPNQVQTS